MLFTENLRLSKNGIAFQDKMGRTLTPGEAIPKILNRFFNYLLDLELFIVRIAGLIPFFSVRWLVYTIAGVKIGRGSHIHMGAQFFYPKNVEIGSDTIIGQNAFLDGRDKLRIGDHVDIASDVMVYNSEHDMNSLNFKAKVAPVDIGNYVFIGPRAIILPGVRIRKGAVVGAGAVVTKEVEEFAVVGGVPAKVISYRENKDPRYKLGRARLFQ